jgi:hypothetical protein
LTEGELKADASWSLSSMPTIGVSGISNWRSGLPILAELQVQSVHVAFDADFQTKPGVARELLACLTELVQGGFRVRLETWSLDDAKGIDDLLAAGKEPRIVAGQEVFEIVRRAIEVTAGADDEDDWVPADPAGTVLPFPVDCLPEAAAQFVTAVAQSIQCPVDFPGLGALVVAASAIGGSRKLRIRHGYEEGPRFYGAVVARPGDGKSPALRAVCSPVFARQQRRRQDYRIAKDEYEQAIVAYDIDRRKAAKESGTTPAPPEKPVKPVMGQVFVENFTAESLGPILDQHPRGVVAIRDELTAWVKSLNQYKGGEGSDREFFLSCWSGEPAKVDRKSDKGESLIVMDPFLAVIGCIPPSRLGELDTGTQGEDGFIHRILFVYPGPVPLRRWDWSGLTSAIRQIWADIVNRLYDLEMDIGEDGEPTARVLELAPEARPIWATWYDRHNEEMAEAHFPDVLAGPWSKLIAYAARLALIVHLLRAACQEPVGPDVDAESLRRALRLIDYFKSHTRAVYARLHQTAQFDRVRRSIAWIRRNGGECHATHLARNNVAGIEKTSEAEAVMKELEDRGYGWRETRKAANNRNVVWFIAKPVQSGPVGSSRVG